MSAITYDVGYTERRNRLTVAFRMILVIPHLIVAYVWNIVAEVVGIIQWFIILFTGKRNEGIWNLQQGYIYYYSRAYGYLSLLFDEYPAFGTDPGSVPVRTEILYEASANRLSNALRLIWVIAAAVIGFFVAIGAAVVWVISWFAIVITGKQPRGMWDFQLKAFRFALQVTTYTMLMTDVYPKYGTGAPAAAGSPPPPPPSSFVPPPPPPPAG